MSSLAHFDFRIALSSLVAAACLTGCASTPSSHNASAESTRATAARERALAAPPAHDVALTIGDAVAELAMDMVGARYRQGGTDPVDGFDSSGLAYYAYTHAGYHIPRGSQEQFRAARKIALGDAGKGDLVFFQDEARLSHVGIYLGDGRFVHAPTDGQQVAVANMSSAYYQEHLVGVGRLLPPGL